MSTDPAMLTGAYAVDALDDVERQRFERHLAVCEDCTREVAELRETAARLGADSTAAPPEELRAKVLAQVAQTRQDPPSDSPPRSAQQSRTRSWRMRLAVAASVIGVALAGVLGGIAWRSQQQLAEINERMAGFADRGAEMAQILTAPDARIVRTSAGGAAATTVVSRELGKAMFLASDLPTPPQDHVYQLWFVGQDGPVSAGMLTAPAQRRTTSVVSGMPAGVRQMAVTVEPAGGSPQPTTDPVMVMSLPA